MYGYFLKTFPYEVDKDGNEKDGPKDPYNTEPTIGDEENQWTRLGNPYMIAVKHNEAAEEAKKKKLPVWVVLRVSSMIEYLR